MKDIKKFSILLTITALMLCSTAYSQDEQGNVADSSDVKPGYTQEIVQLDKNPAMADYIAQSRRKIKNNWYPPTTSFEHTATIIVTIGREGQLIDCSVADSSSDEEFDNSLIKAVKKTKFSPLPDEITGDSVNIDFTFNMQKRKISK